jgi:hypothetical protein
MTSFVTGGVAKYYNAALSVSTTAVATAQLYVPANTLTAGSTFRVSFAGILTAAETLTVSYYYGPLGTTSDPKIWAGVATASATGQTSDMECTCQVIGSSATFYVSGTASAFTAASTYVTTGSSAMDQLVPASTTGTTGNTTTNNVFTVAIATGASTTLAVRTCLIEGLF